MGYYRVLYDEDNWSNLIDELKRDHNTFTVKDRIGLISDAFTLCHANLMPCQTTMSLMSYLKFEQNWGPISTALRHLEKWRRILKYSECFFMLSEHVKTILSAPLKTLGWNNTGRDELRLLRPEVLLASVLWENTDTIHQTKEYLDNLMNNGTAIPANLKEVVYTGAVLSGEYTYWQFCWQRYTELSGGDTGTHGAVERMQLLRALGKTKDAW